MGDRSLERVAAPQEVRPKPETQARFQVEARREYLRVRTMKKEGTGMVTIGSNIVNQEQGIVSPPMTGIKCSVGGCGVPNAKVPAGGIEGVDMEYCPYHMKKFTS